MQNLKSQPRSLNSKKAKPRVISTKKKSKEFKPKNDSKRFSVPVLNSEDSKNDPQLSDNENGLTNKNSQLTNSLKLIIEESMRKMQNELKAEFHSIISKLEISQSTKFDELHEDSTKIISRISEKMAASEDLIKNKLLNLHKRVDSVHEIIEKNIQIFSENKPNPIQSPPNFNLSQKVELTQENSFNEKVILPFSQEFKSQNQNEKRGRPPVKVKEKTKAKQPSEKDLPASPGNNDQNVVNTTLSNKPDAKEKKQKSNFEEQSKSQKEEKFGNNEVSRTSKEIAAIDEHKGGFESNSKINSLPVLTEERKSDMELRKENSISLVSKKVVDFRPPLTLNHSNFSVKENGNLPDVSSSRRVDPSIFNPKRIEPLVINKVLEKPSRERKIERVIPIREKKIKKSTTTKKEYPAEMFDRDGELFCFK